MANAFYRKGAQKILSGAINFSTDTIKARLVKNTYAQNLSTDEFVDLVTAVTGTTDVTLANKSVVDGVFDADDVTWTSVPAGETSEGVVIYKDTGSEATSPLIAYIDVITGFPLATNGGNVVVQWDNGAYKIFSL